MKAVGPLLLLLAGASLLSCGVGARATASSHKAVVSPKGAVLAKADSCNELPQATSEWPQELSDLREVCEVYALECVTLGWSLKTGGHGVTDHESAVHLFECSCAAGNALGCNALGTMFEHGHGVARSAERAAGLYEHACDAKVAEACSNLSAVYEYGRLGKPDPKAARPLYERACELGGADGCAGLGYLYDRGYGVEEDEPRALELYEKACERESEPGCNNLGFAYEHGVGGPKDHKRAFELYQKACTPGYPPGCANLGLMYLYGRGVEKSPQRAAETMKRGCDAWHEYKRLDACVQLSRIVDETDIALISKQQAWDYLRLGCEQNIDNGCLGWGRHLLLVDPPNLDAAREAFQKACSLGAQQGCDAVRKMEEQE